jgi:mannose-6-phosphate isomerase-like protein (cupin superfamily)
VYVVEGEAVVRIGEREHRAGAGALVMIPAGARHHVRNPGRTPLFFVTVYAPPEY